MNKRILKLALPNIISNITVPLLSMVDMALVGHLDSAAYIGAISYAGMILNFLYSIHVFPNLHQLLSYCHRLHQLKYRNQLIDRYC